jgi:hypothetical protein
MKKTILSVLTAAFVLTACNNSPEKKEETPATVSSADGATNTTEKKEATPNTTAMPSPEEIMKKWADFKTPGEEHKWMAKGAGVWTCDSVAQWMDPAAPPTFSKATTTDKVALGGLYIEADYTSTMNGAPMTGKSIFGFDKMKKKYVMTWVDNLGSGIVRMEGDYDAATKTLNMKGKQSDPGMGAEADIRQEQKWLDDNTYTLAMYGTGHDGKEAKFMQGTFKRRK